MELRLWVRVSYYVKLISYLIFCVVGAGRIHVINFVRPLFLCGVFNNFLYTWRIERLIF